ATAVAIRVGIARSNMTTLASLNSLSSKLRRSARLANWRASSARRSRQKHSATAAMAATRLPN
ncbi:hypothetical protein H4S07_006041, partial [Coemansia furcata]